MKEKQQSIVSTPTSAAVAGDSGITSTGSTLSGTTSETANPVLEALSARLIQQGKGISSSSSSELLSTINKAITGTKQSGELTTQRLQSERSREVAFAQDRVSTQFTGALESRRGYATQVAALRDLTETTDKSIRDLDQRYQEAILANDSNTAGQIAQLQMSKLQFQQQQEQSFYQNLFSFANLQQSALDSAKQSEQFWAGQKQNEQQFVMQMAQSDLQFNKNLGIQYQELGLKSQELDISRERNSISRAEFNLKKSELEKEKKKTMVLGKVFSDLRNEVTSGSTTASQLDPAAYALWASNNPDYALMFPDSSFEDYMVAAQLAQSDFVTNKLTGPDSGAAFSGQGGLLGEGSFISAFSGAIGDTLTRARQSVFGVRQGEQGMTAVQAALNFMNERNKNK